MRGSRFSLLLSSIEAAGLLDQSESRARAPSSCPSPVKRARVAPNLTALYGRVSGSWKSDFTQFLLHSGVCVRSKESGFSQTRAGQWYVFQLAIAFARRSRCM